MGGGGGFHDIEPQNKPPCHHKAVCLRFSDGSCCYVFPVANVDGDMSGTVKGETSMNNKMKRSRLKKPWLFIPYGLIVIVFMTQSAFSGPWPRKQGTGFVQVGFSTIGYNKVYDDRGTKNPIYTDVRDNVVQVYADYGLTDLATVTASIPFKFLSATPSQLALSPVATKVTNSGIGDIDLLLRYTWFVVDGQAFSSEVLFALPIGDDTDPNGLWIGDGEFNTAFRLSVGKSFHPEPYFITADVAYNIRGKDFSDEVLYNIELGYGFLENRLLLILLLSGKESASTVPSRNVTAAALGFSTNNQEYTAIIPKVLYKLNEQFGISASFATATHGRNIAGGFVFAGGVFYAF